jgi:hypothetical protein
MQAAKAEDEAGAAGEEAGVGGVGAAVGEAGQTPFAFRVGGVYPRPGLGLDFTLDEEGA